MACSFSGSSHRRPVRAREHAPAHIPTLIGYTTRRDTICETRAVTTASADGGNRYIVHEDPAERRESNYIAHVDLAPFEMPGWHEQVWLHDLGGGTYSLACIPFVVYGLALGDVVALDSRGMVADLLRGGPPGAATDVGPGRAGRTSGRDGCRRAGVRVRGRAAQRVARAAAHSGRPPARCRAWAGFRGHGAHRRSGARGLGMGARPPAQDRLSLQTMPPPRRYLPRPATGIADWCRQSPGTAPSGC